MSGKKRTADETKRRQERTKLRRERRAATRASHFALRRRLGKPTSKEKRSLGRAAAQILKAEAELAARLAAESITEPIALSEVSDVA